MLLPQRLDAGDKVAVVAIASPAQSLRDIHDALELISSSNLSVHIPERRLMWSANKTHISPGQIGKSLRAQQGVVGPDCESNCVPQGRLRSMRS